MWLPSLLFKKLIPPIGIFIFYSYICRVEKVKVLNYTWGCLFKYIIIKELKFGFIAVRCPSLTKVNARSYLAIFYELGGKAFQIKYHTLIQVRIIAFNRVVIISDR